jgi:hypothetical protein
MVLRAHVTDDFTSDGEKIARDGARYSFIFE